MTAHKSQGQTLTKMGLYLQTDFFNHSRMYVAQSHVQSKEKMKVLSPRGNTAGVNGCYVQIVVCREILHD